MRNFLASKNFQKVLPDNWQTHTQKKTRLKSSHLKKYFPNFLTQKNPGIENSNPKKSFDQPRHLKLGAPPWCQYQAILTEQAQSMKDLLCGQKWTFCCGTSEGNSEEAGRQSEERIHWYFAHFWIQQWWPSLPFLLFFSLFFFFLPLSNFAPHSTIWMLVFLQGVRLVSSKQTPMYCKVNFQYKNIASKCLIWLSRVHFRKKFNVYDPWWICLSSHSQLMPLLPMSLPHRFHWPIRPQIVSLCSKPTTWWVWTGVKYM